MVTTILVGHDQTYLNQPSVSARTIRVDTADIGVLDFNLSEAQKTALYDKGFAAAREFLSHWDFADYVGRFR